MPRRSPADRPAPRSRSLIPKVTADPRVRLTVSLTAAHRTILTDYAPYLGLRVATADQRRRADDYIINQAIALLGRDKAFVQHGRVHPDVPPHVGPTGGPEVRPKVGREVGREVGPDQAGA